jgi:DNA-directed RNA polymerase beta subunit
MDELFSTLIHENSTGSSSQMNYNHFHDVLDEEITQEDAWVIINKYFETKGLVRQQLDSFDEFLQNSIQELIDDAGEVRVVPEDQFLSDKQVDKVTRSPSPPSSLSSHCTSSLSSLCPMT